MPRLRRAFALLASTAAFAALAVLFVGPGSPGRPGPASLAAAAEPAAPLTAEERTGYWIDRIVTGPEPTAFPIPDFHQALLLDAIRNLQAAPAATLARLAEPALLARVSHLEDANPWHAILATIAPIGALRPAVARAWAVPALRSNLLTLRREAVPVLAALASPDDAEVLLQALARDADDRVVLPSCLRALVVLGPPWDGAGVRLLLERGIADRGDGESGSWLALPVLLSEVRGGARPDLLAWWALLTEPVAPRAKDPPGSRRTDAEAAPGVVAPPESAFGSGKAASAAARAALAKAGFAAYVAAVAADAAGADAELVVAARAARVPGAAAAPLSEVRAAAAAWLDRVKRAGGVAPEPALEQAAIAEGFVAALGADEDPAAAALLERFLRELPPGPLWTPTMQEAYDALARRGSRPDRIVREWLSSPRPGFADRAIVVIQHSKDRSYIPYLEAWADSPEGAARRPGVRRLVLLLATFMLSNGGMDAEELSAWARKVSEWARDPSDPSAAGILGTLVELGPPGEAQIAAGLSGPDRAAYAALLARPVGRYLSPAVVTALLAPVNAETPAPERRRVLTAAFAVAGGDSAGVVAALSRRLREDDRPEAEMVARIVRYRASSAP